MKLIFDETGKELILEPMGIHSNWFVKVVHKEGVDGSEYDVFELYEIPEYGGVPMLYCAELSLTEVLKSVEDFT